MCATARVAGVPASFYTAAALAALIGLFLPSEGRRLRAERAAAKVSVA